MIRKNSILFGIGGGAYVAIELCYRGWSHWTMFVLGGACFVLMGHLGRQRPRMWIPLQVLAGAGIATAGELLFGMLFNSRYTIWDYRHQAWNLGGQICLGFSMLWIPVSFVAILLFDWFDARL